MRGDIQGVCFSSIHRPPDDDDDGNNIVTIVTLTAVNQDKVNSPSCDMTAERPFDVPQIRDRERRMLEKQRKKRINV